MPEYEGSWKIPLEKKAEIFERNVLERHWVEGIYASMVELRPDGTVDHGTTGWSNVAHSSSWTGVYLAAQALRYALTKDEKVREHAGEVLKGLRRLQQVTGVPGLLARGYALGHGPAYEERALTEHKDEWHQGVGRWSDYRWRGHPSHHNYDHVIRGYGFYYDLAADEEQKEMIRGDVFNLTKYAYLDHDMLVYTVDGRVSTHILGFAPKDRPSLRGLMATSSLKTAYHITGDERFNKLYLELVERFGYRDYVERVDPSGRRIPPKKELDLGLGKRSGFDDAEHVLGDLYNMFRMEGDPELLAFYRLVLERLWENYRDDQNALFNYIYHALSGVDGDDAAALRTLQLYPAVKIVQPKLNSIRKDIKIIEGPGGVKLAETPLPFHERPFDNEYEWKGNPYRLDHYLSRMVVSLEVTREDPMVMYAVDDAGRVYASLTGGETWGEIDQGLGVRARCVVASNRKMRMVFIATDKGVYKTENGGWNSNWRRVPVGSPDNGAYELVADPADDHVLYAVTDEGVFKSLDFGEEHLGEVWRKISGDLPPSAAPVFAVVPGDPAVVHAPLGGIIYRKTEGEDGWMEMGTIAPGFPEAIEVRALKADPRSSDILYAIVDHPHARGVLLRSTDAGRTWTLLGKGRIAERYLRSAGTGLEQVEVMSISIDPKAPSVIYASSPGGVYKSEDGGENWRPVNRGLDIPRASSVFVSEENGRVYAGTPAGLFESADGGESWRGTGLVLQGRGAARYETGSVDFLFAYYLGRYHGFITDEQAKAEFWRRSAE